MESPSCGIYSSLPLQEHHPAHFVPLVLRLPIDLQNVIEDVIDRKTKKYYDYKDFTLFQGKVWLQNELTSPTIEENY